MVPHTLTLSNFLSYRETAELDLRGVHLACISGLNGAGKSSLLDAITWVLFGKSRAGDDDVVNRIAAGHGQAAEVSFVFELEGAVYRVIRRKAVGKTKELELHVRGEEVDGQAQWRVLTEARVSESEKVIRELLRMDYEIFTNASFLLQGKADEFTTKTPDRRKAILAEILGVQQWDDYKALATDKRKAAETEMILLDRELAGIDSELAQEEERRQALELAEARETAVAAQEKAQEALVAGLRQNQHLIEQQQQLLARATTDLETAQGELQRIEREAARRGAELEERRALLDRREEIEAAYADWQAAEADFARWQACAEQHNAIQRERHPLEMALANARTRLEGRQQELEAQGRTAAGVAAELETLSARLAADHQREATLAAQASEAAERERAWHDARERLQTLEAERKLWAQERDQLAGVAAEAARHETDRVNVAASLAAASERLAKALAELALLDEQSRRATEATAELAGLDVELSNLRTVGEDKRDQIETLTKKEGQQCPLCLQPLTPEHRQSTLAALEAEVTALRNQWQERNARRKPLTDEIESLKAAAGRRTQLEKERDTQQGAVGRNEARLQHINTTLESWNANEGRTRLAELQALLNGDGGAVELQAQITELKAAAEHGKQLTREHQILSGEVARAETRFETLERTRQQWEQSGRPELDSIVRQLAEQTFAPDARAALTAVEARLAAVGYDPDGHDAARARRAGLAGAQDEWQQLRQAEAAVKPLSESLDDLNRQGERTAGRVAELRTQREHLSQTLSELQAGAGDLRAAEREMERLRQEQSVAVRATATARQLVNVLKDQRARAKKLHGEKTALAARLALLRQLEEACGRKGVQAMLIEQALPEIEDHANELLYRLSGGEMSVRFPPRKRGKTTGEEIETLDIVIADSSGERPYENYSGGEKFRVNFAIRLALSQVLARRAGARLRTLVIDEGFGSQDPEGRQRLVEAINEIQSEFACILVITHIDELRDKFPARIDVEKTATGSRLAVVAI